MRSRGKLREQLFGRENDVGVGRPVDGMGGVHPGRCIAVVELVGHQARKCIDLLGIYSGDGAALGAVECGLGTFPFGLQGDGALAQNIIDLDDAIFHRTIEPPQAIVGITYLPLRREKPEISGLALRSLTFHQRLQDLSNPVSLGS